MLAAITNFRVRIGNKLSGLSSPVRIAILGIGLILCALIVFWLSNQIFYYMLAKSYADELSQAYNINKGFTKALVWASFTAVGFFAGCVLSFSKRKRTMGYIGMLAMLVGHGVLIGMRDPNYGADGRTEKCYVLTRDGIKILNHVGADPDTGRECRLLTPQMTEKYDAYKNGGRPQLVTSTDPAFFDPVSGEPIIWYTKTGAGRIELFDLMGFHPKTGEELKPVDREVVDEWSRQASIIVRRAPNRVDPDKFGFFDQVSGNAKIWFWTGDAGDYEFYDGPGFHPRNGDALKVVTRDSIAAWRQAAEAAADRKRREQERQAEEARIRTAKELVAKQADQDAKDQADRQAAEDAQKQQQAGFDCDGLATNPTDARRKAPGATWDVLRGQTDQAIEACSKAVQQWPSELRYQYQLARAYQRKDDKKKAFDLLMPLVRAEYPAAFDNLATFYLGKNNDRALQILLRGGDLDDADSMVSLADMIDKGTYAPDNPLAMKLSLLKRAADLGHAGAQRGYPLEVQKARQLQSDQETQRQMLNMFGQIVGGAMRR
jgi:hypothetical protein